MDKSKVLGLLTATFAIGLGIGLFFNTTGTVFSMGNPPKHVTKQSANSTVEQFGLTIADNSPELVQRYRLSINDLGIVVITIESDSRAQHISPQIQPGDLILEINRHRVNSLTQWDELFNAIGVDENVLFTVLHQNRAFYAVMP